MASPVDDGDYVKSDAATRADVAAALHMHQDVSLERGGRNTASAAPETCRTGPVSCCVWLCFVFQHFQARQVLSRCENH
jgi:hypothetical protein